ncbi:hypothetical protein PHYBOEH_010165 [Phytophthora boehmeriae]|uniref:Uncharacterized protein n=1 Tax=Phytophthora boehmeriae TaxID=109152 RepID=A0A8T1VTY3_9STRA|nr:hypothetical protein PHYBOEH_010165 [Phytophthora boehmeriae]
MKHTLKIFQDDKDIGRDEVLTNGERVEGTRGNDAVVDALQKELEQVLARQVGKMAEETAVAVSNALQAVSMAVQHTSNCTESDGVAYMYELLAKFISNDEEIACCYVLHQPVLLHWTSIWTWLTAVMWYVVCDVGDPTKELYEMETSATVSLSLLG